MGTLWTIFLLLLLLLLLSVAARRYTRKRLDSIDGVVGTARQEDIDRARTRREEDTP